VSCLWLLSLAGGAGELAEQETVSNVPSNSWKLHWVPQYIGADATDLEPGGLGIWVPVGKLEDSTSPVPPQTSQRRQPVPQ
jgi:hypothetical protein